MTNPPAPAVRPSVTPHSGRSRRLPLLGLLATAVVAGGLAVANAKSLLGSRPEEQPTVPVMAAIEVEVVAPKAGGIDRVCAQPGTV